MGEGSLLKKLLLTFISLIIIYLTTEWIIRGIYSLFIRSDKYLTFTLPLIQLTKYFIMATVILLTVMRYMSLAPAGKKILPIFLVISVTGIIVSSLCFNAVSEEKLLKYRVIWRTVYTWDDVDYVKPKVYREDPMARPNRVNQYAPLKVYTKYYVHFKDGSVMNAWENIPSVYELHKFVLKNKIDVTYNEMEIESFEQKYTSYFKNEMPEAKFIFYGKTKSN